LAPVRAYQLLRSGALMTDCETCPYSVKRLAQTSVDGYTIYGTPNGTAYVDKLLREAENTKEILRKTTKLVEMMRKELRAGGVRI
jgi:hypothetical protein